MMSTVLTYRARWTFKIATLASAFWLLTGFDSVIDEVYDERQYQKDLPGSPGSCQGEDCAEADSDAVAGSRLRGADSAYNDGNFGQGDGGASWGSGDGSGSDGFGMRKGSIRGEFEGPSSVPSKCDLRKRAGGDDGAIECREEEVGIGEGNGSGEGVGDGLNGDPGVSGQGGLAGGGFGTDRGGEGSGKGVGGGGGGGGGELGDGGGRGESNSGGTDQNPGKRGNEQHGDQQPTADQPPDPVEPPPEPVMPEEEPMPEVEPEQQPPDLFDLLKTVLVVLGVVLLVVMLALLTRAILQRVREGGRERAEIEEEIEGAEELIHELEQRAGGRHHGQWAQEMRYEEAIHALLLEAIKATLKHRRELAKPSTTSREILRDAGLDAAQHAALQTLVRAAELCVFARRQGTEAMYKACVKAHATLCESLERRDMPRNLDDKEVA